MRKGRKKVKTSTIVLICVGVFLLSFVITCLWLFQETGSEPSTLISSVFAICGTEFGILGWIRTTKAKHETKTRKKKEVDEDEFYQ